MTATSKVIITGTIRNVGDLKYTQSGIPNITVGIPESYGKNLRHTTWHDVTFWRESAEWAAKNFYPGSIVQTECSINKRDNGKISFNVSKFQALSNWGKQSSEPAPQQYGGSSYGAPGQHVPESDDFSSDDIPF